MLEHIHFDKSFKIIQTHNILKRKIRFSPYAPLILIQNLSLDMTVSFKTYLASNQYVIFAGKISQLKTGFHS